LRPVDQNPQPPDNSPQPGGKLQISVWITMAARAIERIAMRDGVRARPPPRRIRPMNIAYTIHQAADTQMPIHVPARADCRLLGRFDLEQTSIEKAARLGPSVMVVEIETLTLGEVAATLGRFRSAAPLARLVVLGESGAAAMAQLAVASGAAAYLTRDRAPAVLLSALIEAAKGKWYLSGTGRRAAVSLLGLRA